MAKSSNIHLKVASPCHADWDAMTGDDAIRHCGSCDKNVYQLSNMTTDQVNELFAQPGGACVRFYQRKDGTVMTSDCSVGARIVRRKRAVVGLGAGVLSALYMLVPGPAPVAKVTEPATTTDAHEIVTPDTQGVTGPDTATIEPPEETMMMGLMVEPRMIKGDLEFDDGDEPDDDDE